ncbi:MAG: hypothetical protein JWO78_173 [Micavibrio sp.]|nr:hypothetical protein [Micavibrio sp.]
MSHPNDLQALETNFLRFIAENRILMDDDFGASMSDALDDLQHQIKKHEDQAGERQRGRFIMSQSISNRQVA